MTDWLILTATLPTSPSALRVRVWRALKATGAGALREGVHVLPAGASTADALWEIASTIEGAGADAHMLVVKARDQAQEKTFRALFDRAELHAEFIQSVKDTRALVRKSPEADLRKALRGLDQQWLSLQAIDFFPGPHAVRSAAALAALRREIDLRMSPDEPNPGTDGIVRREIADAQGLTWATRRRPWVDRLATAWLIQRFIDRSPRFTWLADPKKCPKSALGYDFDGATFSHVGDKVTFEVVAATFGLEDVAGIRRLGELVHAIDVGGIPVDEAAGVEMLVRGLQARHAADDALLEAALPLFDALHAALKETE